MSEKVKGLPVQGYKPEQDRSAVDLVNGFKQLEQQLVDLIKTEIVPVAGSPRQQRRLALARTEFETAFYYLYKVVFDPSGGFGDI